MSGYSSQREVRDVIAATLRQESRDPADYNVTGIADDAFYYRGPGYGYGAHDEATWRAAVERHRRGTNMNTLAGVKRRMTPGTRLSVTAQTRRPVLAGTDDEAMYRLEQEA